MLTTRAFRSGNSQAVRIPKEMQIDYGDLWIEKPDENTLIIRKKTVVPPGYKNGIDYLLRTASKTPLSDEEMNEIFGRTKSSEMATQELFK